MGAMGREAARPEVAGKRPTGWGSAGISGDGPGRLVGDGRLPAAAEGDDSACPAATHGTTRVTSKQAKQSFRLGARSAPWTISCNTRKVRVHAETSSCFDEEGENCRGLPALWASKLGMRGVGEITLAGREKSGKSGRQK